MSTLSPTLRGPSGAGHAVPLCIVESHRAFLDRCGVTRLDDLFRLQPDRTFSKPGLPDWRERLRIVLADEQGESRVYFLKRYASPPFREQLRRWQTGVLVHGTAWLEWRWMRRLAGAGLAAVEPVAFGEEMEGWRERRSAVLSSEVAGESLETVAARSGARIDRSLLRRLAEFVGTLHHLGFVHRDLYLCHVFREPTDALRLIDLQRMFAPRWRRRRWFVKDLAALNYSAPLDWATRADRIRFLRHYALVSGVDADRRWCRSVARKTRAIARREDRHGRLPLGQRWLLDA